jgi:hypothetical protein
MLEDAESEDLCSGSVGMLQVAGLMLDNSLSVCDSMLAMTEGEIDEQQHPGAPNLWTVQAEANLMVEGVAEATDGGKAWGGAEPMCFVFYITGNASLPAIDASCAVTMRIFERECSLFLVMSLLFVRSALTRGVWCSLAQRLQRARRCCDEHSLGMFSLLRCFAASLPRCLAASLPRCLAASSLPRCLAASSLPRCLAVSRCLSLTMCGLCR